MPIEEPMRLKTSLLAILVVAASFAVGLKAMDWFSSDGVVPTPKLVQMPPLPPASPSSSIVAPVAISLAAVRDAVERGAPRALSGKVDNPSSPGLQQANIAWTASRDPIAVAGARDALSLTIPLTGTVGLTGRNSSGGTGGVRDALGSLLGGKVAKQMAAIKGLDASADIKGNVAVTARPRLAASWRIEPNFSAQVTLSEGNLSVAGTRLKMPAQVGPLIDKAISDQLDAAGARIRNDSTFEQAARLQWAKFCRSIRLQGAGGKSSIPELWLELRPIRAIAAQPRIDSSAITATLGIEAETRISPIQTKPDCPFPATISLVPPTPGGVSIGVPIDVPLVDISKIVETQLVGRTFPEDRSGSVGLTVKRASVAASGERLLFSLLLNVRENSSYFALGGETKVHIWGRPVLDQARQTVRLTDIELSVESEAALGIAARAAKPYLIKALAEKATIDLRTFVENAQRKIGSAISDLRHNQDGVRVVAEITAIRLADIAFDSKTLRVIAEAEGTMSMYITALPGL
jgi:hypothetical protein